MRFSLRCGPSPARQRRRLDPASPGAKSRASRGRTAAALVAWTLAGLLLLPGPIPTNAALEDDVRQDLEQALRIHGWPCSAVEHYRPLAEDRFAVRCADGHRYRIMLRPGWDLGPKERRTGLRSLLEVARLVENLEARDAESRRSAALRLGDLGPTGTAAAPRLIRTLQDQDPLVRRSAAEALGRIGLGTPEILAALVKGIDDPDPEVGAAAVVALGEIGPAARDAAPALEAALHGHNATVRELPAVALAKINAPPPSETGASAR